MDGGVKPFRWIALFRDGHTIEQPAHDFSTAARQVALCGLFDYLHGTIDNPKKHYLLWFKLTNGEREYIVTFDRDGDAYISMPGGSILMTEFKIRSAELIYLREHDRESGAITHTLGFGGINTCDKPDGKQIIVASDGSWTLATALEPEYDMMSL